MTTTVLQPDAISEAYNTYISESVLVLDCCISEQSEMMLPDGVSLSTTGDLKTAAHEAGNRVCHVNHCGTLTVFSLVLSGVQNSVR